MKLSDLTDEEFYAKFKTLLDLMRLSGNLDEGFIPIKSSPDYELFLNELFDRHETLRSITTLR